METSSPTDVCAQQEGSSAPLQKAEEKTTKGTSAHECHAMEKTQEGGEQGSAFSAFCRGVVRFLPATYELFFVKPKFEAHRLFGFLFLCQWVAAVYLYIFRYEVYLDSPLVWSLPLNGLVQAINAALTFKFLPRREDPGFAAVADKGTLSYFTVLENSFYAMQLLFVCCYLHHDIRYNMIQGNWLAESPVFKDNLGSLHRAFGKCMLEPFFVFFVFYARNLWPSSRIGKALENRDKRMSAKNRIVLTVSTYAIKVFYLFAKHFVGFFVNYLIFLNRVEPRSETQRLLYGIQVLSAYAATISIFIHTLRFKGYIGPLTGMVAYDIIIPGFLYLFWNMRTVIFQNQDLAVICLVGLFLNLAPKPTWHLYQALVALAFYLGYIV